ncbi:MAG: nuclear transport factor 2 family protein [Betaproteobacteria bacterium]|nr:nuclear transport factor 2 family protein [Betaproteobacteria bacterium]
MDTIQRQAIEAECRNLFLAFGRNLDDHNGEAAGKLFAPDAVWDRQGVLVKGPAAVSAVIAGMSPNRMMRHIFTNQVIDVIDEDHAEGRAYYMVYLHDSTGPEDEKLPRPLTGPERIGDYLNKFVRTPAGWRISYNSPRRIFAAR